MDAKKINKMSNTIIDEQFLAGEPHRILQGSIPIIVSAAHAVGQIRHGIHKQSESHTGVLAKLLNRDPGYHAIIKTRNLYDDANYDEKSFYREDLISYINQHQLKFLLDIHIMNPGHRNSIEMATGDRKNIQGNWKIIDKINKVANQAELLIDTDHHFFALNPNCIAAHIANECGIPAIQMEINWSDLDVVKGNNQHFMKIYQFLKDIQTTIV